MNNTLSAIFQMDGRNESHIETGRRSHTMTAIRSHAMSSGFTTLPHLPTKTIDVYNRGQLLEVRTANFSVLQQNTRQREVTMTGVLIVSLLAIFGRWL